jgi:hypothetical protein
MASKTPNVNGILISECGFDEATLKLLQLSRFYFVSYSAGRMPDCQTAVDICAKEFGRRYAVEIAIAMLCVLGAMRQSRKTMFRYNSRACPGYRTRVTDCERLLFLTVQFFKNENYGKAHVTAMMLCEGHDTTQLFNEIASLKSFLEKAENSAKKIS